MCKIQTLHLPDHHRAIESNRCGRWSAKEHSHQPSRAGKVKLIRIAISFLELPLTSPGLNPIVPGEIYDSPHSSIVSNTTLWLFSFDRANEGSIFSFTCDGVAANDRIGVGAWGGGHPREPIFETRKFNRRKQYSTDEWEGGKDTWRMRTSASSHRRSGRTACLRFAFVDGEQ